MHLELINPYSYELNDNNIGHRVKRGHLVDKIGSHRGVEVFRESRKHFLYVHDGVIIAERSGADKERSKGIIDDYLDSTTNHTSTAFHAFERMQKALTTGEHIKTLY